MVATATAPWAEHYVGLPFADRGRSRRGLDCWGLVRLVLHEQFGKFMPSLACDYSTCVDLKAVRALVDLQVPVLRARRVDDPEPGDVVLLRLRGVACHVGVYVGGGNMLHVRAGCDAVVEELSRPTWARRVKGYYRVPR